jgi:hypothetical protein
MVHEEFFEEKFPYYVLFAIILWFIMATIHIPNKVLEKSILVGINVQIAVIYRKKTEVFGKI